MKLSIIIPVYNCEKYIEACLDSLFFKNENNDKLEVILINDGSTDKTNKILDNYIYKEKMRVFNNKNHGVSFSRNYGIKKATGDYIMFVDADDILSNDWFINIEKFINNEYEIVYFSSNINKNENNKAVMLNYIIGNNKENICLAGPFSKLYNRKMIIENNIYFYEDLINGEDMLFNVNVLFASKSYTVVNYSFYNYRQYEGSSTKLFNTKIFETDLRFHEYLKKILNESNVPKEEEKVIINFCLVNAIIIILDKISYISKYSSAKKYMLKLYDNPYINISHKDKYGYLSRKSKMKYLFYKYNLKYFLFLILKLNHKRKSNKTIEKFSKI